MNRKIIVFFLIIILQLNFISNSHAGSFVVLTKIGAKIGSFWDDVGRSINNLGNDLNFLSNSHAGSFVVLTKIGAKIGAFWDDI